MQTPTGNGGHCDVKLLVHNNRLFKFKVRGNKATSDMQEEEEPFADAPSPVRAVLNRPWPDQGSQFRFTR
ncbi:hypothetical protein EJB05_34738, partial [Eragrostis curvula]